MPPKFRLLADENIRAEVIRFLSENHDVIEVPKGIKNGAVIQLAKLEKRILVTRDKDFSNTEMYNPILTHGIIFIRIHPPTVADIVHALTRLFTSITAEELKGKLVLLERETFTRF